MADCPICGKAVTAEFKPFCSKRCADIDLGRWLKGTYAIPGSPAGPQTSDTEAESGADTDEP